MLALSTLVLMTCGRVYILQLHVYTHKVYTSNCVQIY